MVRNAVRRFAGLVMVAVGLLGLALCVYLGGQVGWAARRITHETPVAVAQLEAMVDSLHLRGADASEILQATRDRLQSVRETVDELPADTRDPRVPPVMTTVNVEIVASLERAEAFVRSMQTNLETTSGALLLIESIPFLGASLSQPAASNGRSNLQNLADGLREISAALSQGAGLLAEFRTGRGIEPAQVVRLQQTLDQVDAQLQQILAQIERFNAAISTMDARLDRATAQIQQRVLWVATLSITFFICFAFSQLNLILQGWRFIRGRGSNPPPAATVLKASPAGV